MWVRSTAISAIRFSAALIFSDSSLRRAVAAHRLFRQHLVIQKAMIVEIVQGLRHLFQVEFAGPPRISGSLTGAELA